MYFWDCLTLGHCSGSTYQIWCHHGQEVGKAVEVSEATANTLVIIFRRRDRWAGHRSRLQNAISSSVDRIFWLHRIWGRATEIGRAVHIEPGKKYEKKKLEYSLDTILREMKFSFFFHTVNTEQRT